MRFGFKVFGGLEARDEQRRCAAGRSSTKHKPAVVVSHHTTAPQPTSPPRSAWIHAEPGGMRSSRQPPSGVPNVPSPIARLLDDSGSLEPQNSILMTTKLHGYRSSMAVSGGLGGGWEAAARPPLPWPALPQRPYCCCRCPACRSPTSAPSSRNQRQRAAASWCSSKRQPPP
jgi:hypothetical protein